MTIHKASDYISPNPGKRKSIQITKRSLNEGRNELALLEKDGGKLERPTKRYQCPTTRPCPYVSCRHNLYLDVRGTGSITENYEDLQPEQMQYSCTLDIADKYSAGLPLGTIGEIMNLTRERIRQIEAAAIDKLVSGDVGKHIVDGLGE